MLEEHELPVGRAYALGFLCHYSLDRAMHPLVYCQQYAICDAGIDGLNRSQENEVHAEIEREYDEMVLFSKLGRTIRSYRPFEEALHASEHTLQTIGKMYAFVAMKAYRTFPPVDLFVSAVHDFRRMQRLFYSPNGTMQSALNVIETRVLNRQFSFYKSMSHRDNATRERLRQSHAPPLGKPVYPRSEARKASGIFSTARKPSPSAQSKPSIKTISTKPQRALTGSLRFLRPACGK